MSPIGFDLDGNVLLKGEDYHWLMEQEEGNEELELEKDGWKYTAQSYYMKIQELREQNKRYREALEFYADENNYVVDISEVEFLEDIPYAKPPIVYERGIKARKALEVNENE